MSLNLALLLGKNRAQALEDLAKAWGQDAESVLYDCVDGFIWEKKAYNVACHFYKEWQNHGMVPKLFEVQGVNVLGEDGRFQARMTTLCQASYDRLSSEDQQTITNFFMENLKKQPSPRNMGHSLRGPKRGFWLYCLESLGLYASIKTPYVTLLHIDPKMSMPPFMEPFWVKKAP